MPAPSPARARLTRFYAIAALAIVAFIVGALLDLAWLRLVVKPLPVLALAAAIMSGTPDRYGRRIALGLCASAVGDLFLEPRGYFLHGVAAFFVAHLFYIAAFVGRGAAPSLLRALPFAAWGILAFGALRPGLGALEIPVGVYCAALCTMGWRAAALLGRGHGGAVWLAAGGAVLFMFSDTIIAFNRFHAPIAGAHVLILTTYWLGQLGIASAALRAADRRV